MILTASMAIQKPTAVKTIQGFPPPLVRLMFPLNIVLTSFLDPIITLIYLYVKSKLDSKNMRRTNGVLSAGDSRGKHLAISRESNAIRSTTGFRQSRGNLVKR